MYWKKLNSLFDKNISKGRNGILSFSAKRHPAVSKSGLQRSSIVDNARYIDSLRGHLDSGGAVSVHRKRYCNAANVAHRRRLCYKDTERSVTG